MKEVSERTFNFSAGPAVLPEEVLKVAQESLWNHAGSGIGILEHSHRGAEFSEVLSDAVANCRKLAGISDDYAILFLQGGASTQFLMLPQNWLGSDQTADYINTGSWSKKAIAEAKRFGNVNVAGSSDDENFNYIPSELSLSESPSYVHFTSNNTIAGTEWKSEPATPGNAFLACDASSDIFSRPINVSKYGVIYAGAQKNLGPSGTTLVILRKDLLEKAKADVPTMLSYKTHVEKDSCFNTPPTFGVFIIGETFKWLLERGGLEAMEQHNQEKANLLYSYLDESPYFRGTARQDSRSLMNITFRGRDEDAEKKFIAEAAAAGLKGLKGHRSVGGMRASIYNAFPKAGCEQLVQFMADFEKKNK